MSNETKRLKAVIGPLSKREERQAIKAVIDRLHADLEQGQTPRFRVLGAELQIEKPPKRQAVPQRQIRVLVADYDKKQNLDIVVDRQGKILRMEPYRGFQPAFHAEEITEARTIADSDHRMARLAKQRGVCVSAFGPAQIVPQSSRLVGLRCALLPKSEAASFLASVVVDLCAREIVACDVSETDR
jgi:Cu2+-containing amine oxidase